MENPSADNALSKKPSGPSKRAWRYLLWFGLLLIIAVLLFYAFRPTAIYVKTFRVRRAEFQQTIEVDGKTRFEDRYVVSAPLSATLSRSSLNAGDKIAIAQPLLVLRPTMSPLLDQRSRTEARAHLAAAMASQKRSQVAVDAARTDLELAERQLDRVKILAEQGAAPAEELERAQFQSRSRTEELSASEFAQKVANHEAAMARAALGVQGSTEKQASFFEVPSPVDGVILRVLKRDEGVVAAGTPLLEIGDPTTLEIVSEVLTTEAVKIKVGMPVLVENWGKEQKLKGHVYRIEPAAFTRISSLGVEEQRVNVVIRFSDESARVHELGDGYHVEVKIIIWQEKNVLQVPIAAVFRNAKSRWAVYVVKDGKAKLREVSVVRRSSDAVQISKGLKQHETVILFPSDLIKDGVSIDTQN
ncbi:MAG: HlyD family efflux transporter periplasmic adaptor subunit [Myxococcales bacterium]|nr:MAG: HlyD family efflux transporter periplasmic adaptor subunit [Myxococcales bacterium]